MKPRFFNSSYALLLCSIITFASGALLITLPKGSFHEIEYRPKEILNTILSKANNVKGFDAHDPDTLMVEIRYRQYLLNNLSNSQCDSLLFAKQLYVNEDTFKSKQLLDFAKATVTHHTPAGDSIVTVPILWDYYVSYSLWYQKRITPFHLSARITSQATRFRRYMDFFTEYPCFILWALLVIVQFPVFLFLGVFAFREIRRFNEHVTPHEVPLKNKIWLSAFVVAVFVTISFLTFFIHHPIMGGLFCDQSYVDITFSLLLLFAGFCGVGAFTGFMVVDEYSRHHAPDHNMTITGLHASKADADKFNVLNRLFNRMLITASLALSIIVLTTGVLFNGLNSMEFIQKITDDFSYPPVSYNFVFMIGILCSGLILLFFFPAKISLMAFQKDFRNKYPSAKGIEKPEDILAMLKTLFTVSLPALVPVFHSVISLFVDGK